MNYLKTWFVPDFMSSFPFDYLYEMTLGENPPLEGNIDDALITLRVLRYIFNTENDRKNKCYLSLNNNG